MREPITAEQLQRLINEGLSVRGIGRHYGIECRSVRYLLDKYNLKTNHPRTYSPDMTDKVAEIHRLRRLGYGVEDIKKKVHCSNLTVVKNCRHILVPRMHTCWTTPERVFKELLNECGFGVRFPEHIKRAKNLTDDHNPTIEFQYQMGPYTVDFADPVHKIVYQVNGDYWHANPDKYTEAKYPAQKSARRRDKGCQTFLERRGWRVVFIWEDTLLTSRKHAMEQIRMAVKLVAITEK